MNKISMPVRPNVLCALLLMAVSACRSDIGGETGHLATTQDVPHESGDRQLADTIWHNGKVFIAKDLESYADAVAVVGNRVLAVGLSSDVLKHAGENTAVVDLEGRFAMPGFIDTHCHVAFDVGSYPRVDFFRLSFEEAKEAIRQFATSQPDLPVVYAIGSVDLGDEPARALDSILADRPLLVSGEGLHRMYFNSRAAELAGITKATPDPDPPISYFGRDDDGNPIGLAAEGPAIERVSVILDEARRDYLARYVENPIPPPVFAAMSRWGITSCFEAATLGLDPPSCQDCSESEVNVADLFLKLEARGDLSFRLFGSYMAPYGSAAHGESIVQKLTQFAEKYDTDLVRLKHVKLFIDGDGPSEAHWEGVLSQPDVVVPTIYSQEQLNELVTALEEAKIDVHFHTIGNRAVSTAIDAIEHSRRVNATKNENWDPRYAFAHLLAVRETDMKRMAQLGIIASVTPGWGSDSLNYRYNLGDRVYEPGVYRYGSLQRAGVRLTFGADYPVWGSKWFNPFWQIETGLTRQNPGEKDDSVAPKESDRVSSLGEMLLAYTRNGAFMLRVEDDLGSIEPGKLADMIVLEQDPFEVDTYDLHKIEVWMTMLDGRVVYEGEKSLDGSKN